MLIRSIKRIRRKPKHVRDQYAFGIAATVTVCVVLLWVWQLPDRLPSEADIAAAEDNQQAFSSFMSEIQEQFSGEAADLSAASVPDEQLPAATVPAVTSPVTATSGRQSVPTPTTAPTRPIRIATTSVTGE